MLGDGELGVALCAGLWEGEGVAGGEKGGSGGGRGKQEEGAASTSLSPARGGHCTACCSRGEVLRQFAARVTACSSQRSATSGSAAQVLGPPRVYPNYGDSPHVWRPGTVDGDQYIQVEFRTAVLLQHIEVYETLHAGAIWRLSVRDLSGAWRVAWTSHDVAAHKSSRILSPPLKLPSDMVTREVRVHVDCRPSGGRVGVDGVCLVGPDPCTVAEPSLQLLCDEFRQLLVDHSFSDVTLYAGGSLVPAHRGILVARCRYFRDLLAAHPSGGQAEVVEVSGVEVGHLRAALEFIYTGQLSAATPTLALPALYQAAATLTLPALQQLCLAALGAELTPPAALSMHPLVHPQHQLAPVTELCTAYMARNIRQVAALPGFRELADDVIAEIRQRAALYQQEDENRSK